MKVELVYFDGCPHWQLAYERLRRAVRYADIGEVEISVVSVGRLEDAPAAGLVGSPTILIDGVDPFADDNRATGISCRIYETGNGLSGAPGVIRLTRELQRAAGIDPYDATAEASFPASDPPEVGEPGI